MKSQSVNPVNQQSSLQSAVGFLKTHKAALTVTALTLAGVGYGVYSGYQNHQAAVEVAANALAAERGRGYLASSLRYIEATDQAAQYAESLNSYMPSMPDVSVITDNLPDLSGIKTAVSNALSSILSYRFW